MDTTFHNCLFDLKHQSNRPALNFNKALFQCVFCNEPMLDPITLRCGHTFSKKCVVKIAETEGGKFACPRCETVEYDMPYISTFKPNITAALVIRKFWETCGEDCFNFIYEDKSKHVGDCFCDFCIYNGNTSDKAEKLLEVVARSMDNPQQHCVLRRCTKAKIREFYYALHNYFISCAKNLETIRYKRSVITRFTKYLEECQKAELEIDEEFPSEYDAIILQGHSIAGANVLQGRCCAFPAAEGHNMCLQLARVNWSICKATGVSFIREKLKNMYFNADEFECILCMRMFLDPFTSPCGHTFCKLCYYRCLDYEIACPLCKSLLVRDYKERVIKIDEFIEVFMRIYFADKYRERRNLYESEMFSLCSAGQSPQYETPLFVCGVGFPSVPCKLHVYEPRYRNMIRKCLESGGNKFGMCDSVNNIYGTLMKIKSTRNFEDGRSILNVIGIGRFKILQKGDCDGYQVATVESVIDDNLCMDSMPGLEQVHSVLNQFCAKWFLNLPDQTKDRILGHYNNMPIMEPDDLYKPDGPPWMWWMFSILPIEKSSIDSILGLRSLIHRMFILEKIIMRFNPNVSTVSIE